MFQGLNDIKIVYAISMIDLLFDQCEMGVNEVGEKIYINFEETLYGLIHVLGKYKGQGYVCYGDELLVGELTNITERVK